MRAHGPFIELESSAEAWGKVPESFCTESSTTPLSELLHYSTSAAVRGRVLSSICTEYIREDACAFHVSRDSFVLATNFVYGGTPTTAYISGGGIVQVLVLCVLVGRTGPRQSYVATD